MSQTHRVLLSEDDILEKIEGIATQICEDYRGQEVILVGILKGAFVFLSDLAREIEHQSQDGKGVSACFVEFMSISSYGDSRKPGDIRIEHDVRQSVRGQNVIIVEDVADSLETLYRVRQILSEKGAAEIRVAVLLEKPEGHKRSDVSLDYVCFRIENAGFVYGYGMDVAEKSRALPFVAVADPE
ncbi:hypoxanthine phosphoribosyltransferase [Candidatus Uhrbacteria bacterium RIFCSPHIGHO2_12_FULL_47_12]|nr:MAG: hypoxanthine phosphoribosyltransferase [Candidatus Uhrbacteria bacterium RIFCSPHIGHO2_12_FULL_47_12]